MTAKIIETNIPQANLPLVYNIVSSGAMELSYKDKISIGRLFHIQVNDEWRDYYILYIGLLDQNKMPNLAENNDKEIYYPYS